MSKKKILIINKSAEELTEAEKMMIKALRYRGCVVFFRKKKEGEA